MNLKNKNFVGLAQVIVAAEDSGDTTLAGQAMAVAESKGIWEETLDTVSLYREKGRWL